MTINRDDAGIVEAIIATGQSLDLALIAEGVEGSEQLKFLLNHNCFEMQGYFFARPMPAADMERYLQDSFRRKGDASMKSARMSGVLSRNDAHIEPGI